METIRFDPRAADEFVKVVEFYESDAEGLGSRFAEVVKKFLRSIDQNPKIHGQVMVGCRKCRVPRFPYNLLYREHPNGIQVIAVAHMKIQSRLLEKARLMLRG